MGVRKNQRNLTAAEKSRFIAAVKEMKRQGDYDWYVRWHLEGGGMLGGPVVAHGGPAFLPWHRYFILSFEQDLQAADRRLGGDGSVTLPYWDWTKDRPAVANNTTGSIWKDDFMGPNGRTSDGRVMTGPFATDNPPGNWRLNVSDPMGPADTILGRRFRQSGATTLPTAAQVTSTLGRGTYDLTPWDTSPTNTTFRNTLEGWARIGASSPPQMHNRVHVWVGSVMGGMASPNDPIFFLNHCFIDLIWAQWQAHKAAVAQYPADGTVVDGAGNRLPGQNLNDPMVPWDGRADPRPGRVGNLPVIRPANALDHAAMGYTYDREPF
jgi:tyrosinase